MFHFIKWKHNPSRYNSNHIVFVGGKVHYEQNYLPILWGVEQYLGRFMDIKILPCVISTFA